MYVSHPSACHGNETSTLKHTLSNFIKNQTFGASRRLLSMYVCLKTLSLSRKLASNKNRLMMIWTKNVSTCSKPLSLSWKSSIHTRLNFLEFDIFEGFSDAFKHVCMFQIPLPVMENETYTLKHEPSISITNHTLNASKEALHHVCMFENPLPVMENETYTLEHELESSTSITENRRQRYPYRGIVMLNDNTWRKTLPLSRNRRVHFRVCLNKVQKPSPCEGFCVWP